MDRKHRLCGERSGFTLIEAVVVVSIIAILAALLIPALQAAREASRRSGCAANLRQLGLAVQAYEARFGCLPPGHGHGGASFLVAILPDLEQGTLYHALNLSLGGLNPAQENRTAFRTSLSVLACPSDPGTAPGRTNYAGSRGVGVQRYGYNGAFSFPSLPVVRARDFRDGLSGTSLLCEWLTAPADPLPPDPRLVVLRTGREATAPDQFDSFAAECLRLDPRSAPQGAPTSKGSNWLFGEFGFTLYNHTLGPNRNSCTNGSAFQQGAWTASGGHPRGVNLLFADGHARFITEGVQIGVWRAIGSRDGAETIPEEF